MVSLCHDMLSSLVRFLGFDGDAETPKPRPRNGRRRPRKLRKIRHPNIPINIPVRSTPMERVQTPSTVHSEGEDSGEHYQNQETTTDRPNNTPHTFQASPNTQADDTNHLSSISEDPSEGSKETRVQTPVSVAPSRLWGSIPSAHRNSFPGGEDPFAHELDDDRGGAKGLVKSESAKRPRRLTSLNVDRHQHDAQEPHDAEKGKKASQQQNIVLHRPAASRANPREEEESWSRRGNVSQQDLGETSKAAILRHGDRVKDGFQPEMCYYIVPAGLDIIFQDEDGNEITRVGRTIGGPGMAQDSSSRTTLSKNVPFVVQDVSGDELFRSWTLEAKPSPSTSWRTVIVDEEGKQIPLKYYDERNVGRSRA